MLTIYILVTLNSVSQPTSLLNSMPVFNSLWYYLMVSNYFSLYVSPQKAKENKINANTHQFAPQTTTSSSPDLLIHNLFSLPPHAIIATFLM